MSGSGSAAVCVVGSVNVDLVTGVARLPAPGQTVAGRGLARLPGGKGANQALAAARAGARVGLVGRVGDDDAGTAYRRGLARRGVDCAHLWVTPDETTGQALVTVDDYGENTIVVVSGANARLRPADLDAALPAIRAAAVVLVQLEVPLDTVARAARLAAAAGARVVLNPSPWPDAPADLLVEVLAAADPVIVNEHEADRLPSGVARSVCVTLGSRGARWGRHAAPAGATTVVDSTGAGDAFAGTLAAALATGTGPADALSAAVAAGSAACAWPGAQGWTL